MGRAKSGMENDGPIADACKMPSFISGIEEGRVKLSRNLPTQTSLTDGKVERTLGDLSRRVTRSNSRLSLDESDRDPGGKDAEGNNNNNCNGGGRARRRASAVDILRKNFGDSKSPSFRLNRGSRMQCGAELENHEGNVNDTQDYVPDCSGSTKSDVETGEAEVENEQTSSELPSLGVRAVELLTVTGQRHHTCDNSGSTATPEGSVSAKEHVYCTVYCIANDSHGKDAEITDRSDDTVAADASERDLETGQPQPYTVDDLVDPFGDLSHRLSAEQADAEGAMQSCRVCMEEKTIAPLPCCRKAVCDECLKLYVSSQVRVGKALIGCPITECSGNLEEGLVISHLTKEEVAKYRYFLELSQLDSSTKPCPQCSQFTSLKTHNPNRSEHKYKIHIQRTEGCDHMTCVQCNTNFCYRCGERYRHLRFFGDHTSNLSVFGCKYRYLPDKPHLRRLIRGSVCASKVLIAPVVILLVVVLGALALVIGLVVFPIYYVCKKRKKQQRTRGSGRWI
ncbi:probable E3 ubiquitin-protein ligase RNF217 [Neolamprologus brichardi]|uniref:probable E3 ubiquitin-protein ligase RNF217 n=1 Tax=Neolamprologus brichardi TaxID=32507 RepID=UPI0003EC0832|nr:probable E3 ubiquitin-protein ligase RNF217 [Neolamprologus brichardi]